MDKTGHRQRYESVYLRRTYRQDGRVRNQTVANISMLPAEVITSIEAGLKGVLVTVLSPAAMDDLNWHDRWLSS